MPIQKSFQLFDLTHSITIGIIFLISALYVFIARHKQMRNWTKPMSWVLATVLLVNELIYIGGAISKGLWHYSWGIPLQLCDLAIFAVVFSLFIHRQFIWELAYFWGLGGTLQAVLTPELLVTFPEYIYIKFFLTHGCILVGVIYLSAGLGRPITFQSVKRVWLITNIYALFIGIVNWLAGTNYLYLCHKPSQASLIDHFGPWPFYLFGLEIALIFSLLVYYLPYYIAGRLYPNSTGAG